MTVMIPRSVIQMTEYPQAVTASLQDFLLAYSVKPDWWWGHIDCRHHRSLFDMALERIYLLERDRLT